jgi:hypothetical protein
MADLFAGEPVPLGEQIREIERELETRRAVYPRWVQAGRLSFDVAKRRVLIMEAVLAELKGRQGGADHGAV